MATEFREESSVSFHRNEFDELVFHSDRNGEVIHRTPEELGLARVVKDTPPERRIDIRPEWSDRPGGNSMSRARAKRDAAPKLHAIRGVQVRMSAYSSMGAEMIDLIADEEEKKILVTKEQGAPAAAAEQTKRSETAMSGRNRLHDPETKAKILAESSDTPAGEIAKKYGVETSYVYYLRGEARKRGGGVGEAAA